ncbi:hypothetical protein ABR737_41440 [Streptomyces sp. Edi2]|uniref:hypothetical protein n=1 Tax=Streptomyces sp. Edi2 TaxID=3162528 RepID=UPI0033061945
MRSVRPGTTKIVDIVLVTARPTSPEEINDLFREETTTDRYRGILGVSDEPIVSSDIIGDSRASIVDAAMTRVVDGTLVKIMSWYDNEWGFMHQMVRECSPSWESNRGETPHCSRADRPLHLTRKGTR